MNDLLKKHRKKIINDVKYFIEQLKDEFNLSAAYLFGSFVRKSFKESSDIDVALVSDKFEGFTLADIERILNKTKNINRMIEPHLFRTEAFTENIPFGKEIISTSLKQR